MSQAETVKIIECPRDAMQGYKNFIDTNKKADYINSLLKVGFDTIDFGSFVSHDSVPQMADTSEVLSKLDLENTESKLLAIVANLRGAKDAAGHYQITYLGFPFSVSETFQKRNTNSTIQQSLGTVDAIQNLCQKNNKTLVIYISMGFGNPYGDQWNGDIVLKWIEKLSGMDINIFSISDTVGIAKPDTIKTLFKSLFREFAHLELGAHFHTTADKWKEKIDAAFEYGCRRYDGAIKGYGGCPMAGDELVGNMPTENLISYFEEKKLKTGINKAAFAESIKLSTSVFS